MLEKYSMTFLKQSSHCSLHTSCVPPVLIQIAPFNPTSEQIAERIVVSQQTELFVT